MDYSVQYLLAKSDSPPQPRHLGTDRRPHRQTDGQLDHLADPESNTLADLVADLVAYTVTDTDTDRPAVHAAVDQPHQTTRRS